MMTQSQFKPAVRTNVGHTLLLVFVAGLICNGCLSKPALKTEMFAFQNPPPAAASSTGAVIAVNSVTVSALFDNNSFVYRTGPESYEVDPYASFMAAPEQTIAIAICAHIRGSGRFQNVVEPGSTARADKLMEVRVFELYGDFSQPGHGTAVLSMQISLFNGDDGKSNRPVLQKNYSRRIPLERNTAAGVMSGWNTALNEIMSEFLGDVVGQNK